MSTKQSRPLIRWLVRASLGGVVLILLAFAGSNLFLGSKPGQKFLQKNLNRRTPGLSWQVSGASWSPWNGITVKNLAARLQIPEANKSAPMPPLFTLKETELKPYWGQLIRGKKLFREIIIDQPQLNIPVEYLVIAEPTAPTPEPDPQPSPKAPEKKQADTPKPPTPTPKQAKPKPAPKAQPKPKAKPRENDEKRFWVRLRNAKVRLYSIKLNKAVEIEELNADLPLAGPATKGSFSWSKITFQGQPLTAKVELPIEWKNPDWTLPNQDLALTLPQFANPTLAPIPFTARIGGSFSPRRPSRNFRFNAALPPQALPDYLVHENSRFHLRSPSVAANFSSQGALIDPNSWYFESAFAMSEIEVFSELRKQHLFFDSARAQIGLRQSTLLAPEIALRSERLSVLGNGQLHLGGYLLAVTRVVAEPELADRIRGVAIGSHIIPWRSRWLSPMETPDRYYRDFHFEGFFPNPLVNAGPKGEFMPVPQVIDLIRNFTNEEVAEELPTPSNETSTSP